MPAIAEQFGTRLASLGITSVGADVAMAVYHYAHMVPLTNGAGTNTTPTAELVYVSSIHIPCNCTLTGLSYLIGGTGGTDKAIAMLFDCAGLLLANSATAGVTVGTQSTFQRLPFTAPVAVTGPGMYFVGIQYNGNTARIRTQIFGDHRTAVFAQTFGSPVAMTSVPTTFTTAYGPIVMTY